MFDINIFLLNLGFYTAIASFIICSILIKQITKLRSDMSVLTLEITKLKSHKSGVKND